MMRRFTTLLLLGALALPLQAQEPGPAEIVEQVAGYYPAVRDIEIPDRMANNVTPQ